MLTNSCYLLMCILTLIYVPIEHVPLVLLLLVGVLLVFNKKSFYTPSAPVKGIGFQMYNNKPINDDLHADAVADENWNATRLNDLKIIKKLGVEDLRLYEWSWVRNHGNFFRDLESQGLKTCIPISMYNFLNPGAFTSDTWKTYLNKEFLTPDKKYRNSIKYIMIGNEPEITAAKDNWQVLACDIIQKILDAEKSMGVTGALPIITVPVSSGTLKGGDPGFGYLGVLDAEMKSRGIDISDRYIGCINFTMAPADIKAQVLDKYDKPIIIGELSPPPTTYPLSPTRTDEMASRLTDALALSNVAAVFAFQYFDPTNKTGTERGFGMTCFTPEYDVDSCVENNKCPPDDTKLGNRAKMLNGVAKAYGGMVDDTLFGASCQSSSLSSCVPKAGADSQKVNDAIGYACGILGDCSGNPCTNQPSPPYGSATWVFSKFYKEGKGSCDFGGVAELSSSPTYPSCVAE